SARARSMESRPLPVGLGPRRGPFRPRSRGGKRYAPTAETRPITLRSGGQPRGRGRRVCFTWSVLAGPPAVRRWILRRFVGLFVRLGRQQAFVAPGARLRARY